MGKIDAAELDRVGARLGEAALDPGRWPDLMESICRAVDATCAMLLQSDSRTPDVPGTESAKDHFRIYFRDGWHTRDLRARCVPLLLAGQPVVVDADLFTAEEMHRHSFFNDCVRASGLEWWAGIGLRAESALWVLALQRTAAKGAFGNAEKQSLGPFSRRLTETATLSTAVGRETLFGITSVLDRVRRPAISLDRIGRVLGTNAGADGLFDDELGVRHGQLICYDKRAQAQLDAMLCRLRAMPDTAALDVEPIVIRRSKKAPVIARAIPIDGAARNPFLGARALLLLDELGPRENPRSEVLADVFGLTPAEARLASLLASGISLAVAARQLGVARETVRNQLKAIFAKTETHRQPQLVALLSRMTL
jgi:DNA-binding CsgD family transcriptional regulator